MWLEPTTSSDLRSIRATYRYISYLAVNNLIALSIRDYFYLNSVLLDHFLMIHLFKPIAIMIMIFIVFCPRTIGDWNSLYQVVFVLVQIFHSLKITVCHLLETIDRSFFLILFILSICYLSYIYYEIILDIVIYLIYIDLMGKRCQLINKCRLR